MVNGLRHVIIVAVSDSIKKIPLRRDVPPPAVIGASTNLSRYGIDLHVLQETVVPQLLAGREQRAI